MFTAFMRGLFTRMFDEIAFGVFTLFNVWLPQLNPSISSAVGMKGILPFVFFIDVDLPVIIEGAAEPTVEFQKAV